MIFSDYIIRTPHKHPFSREKQFGLYNLNCISTNYEHVCNMDSHFMNNINLRNFHPSVLGHCWLFLVKNQVFGLLDQIAPKLPQKIRKKSRITTPLEETSYETPPLKIQNSTAQTHFSFFLIFIFSEKSEKNCISFI